MYKDLIGSTVTIVVSSRGNVLLEYTGTITGEDDKNVYLKNVSISYLMLNYQKGFFGDSFSRYKEGLDQVILNKKYIVSCNKQ